LPPRRGPCKLRAGFSRAGSAVGSRGAAPWKNTCFCRKNLLERWRSCPARGSASTSTLKAHDSEPGEETSPGDLPLPFFWQAPCWLLSVLRLRSLARSLTFRRPCRIMPSPARHPPQTLTGCAQSLKTPSRRKARNRNGQARRANLECMMVQRWNRLLHSETCCRLRRRCDPKPLSMRGSQPWIPDRRHRLHLGRPAVDPRGTLGRPLQ